MQEMCAIFLNTIKFPGPTGGGKSNCYYFRFISYTKVKWYNTQNGTLTTVQGVSENMKLCDLF